MESALQLSLEQEFNLRAFREQVADMTEDQKSKYLIECLRQLMIKNNVIQHLIANNHEMTLFEGA